MKPTWVEVLLLPFDNIDRRNKETASKGLLVKKCLKFPRFYVCILMLKIWNHLTDSVKLYIGLSGGRNHGFKKRLL